MSRIAFYTVVILAALIAAPFVLLLWSAYKIGQAIGSIPVPDEVAEALCVVGGAGAMSRPHNLCEQRSEKHARQLARDQRPARDPQVERLMRDGYNQQQIAALTGKSMIDVRIAMNAAGAFP